MPVELIGLVGVILGATLTFLTFHIKRKDELKFIQLEKRLEIHQAGYKIVCDFDRGVMVRSREYLDKLWDAKDWLDSNCLYLDVQSVKAIDECIAHLMGEHIFPDDPKRLDLEFMKKYDELKSDALRKLSEGVGVPWSKSKIKKEHEKLREK